MPLVRTTVTPNTLNRKLPNGTTLSFRIFGVYPILPWIFPYVWSTTTIHSSAESGNSFICCIWNNFLQLLTTIAFYSCDKLNVKHLIAFPPTVWYMNVYYNPSVTFISMYSIFGVHSTIIIIPFSANVQTSASGKMLKPLPMFPYT